MNRLTLDVKTKIVRFYSKSEENASEVQRKLYHLAIDESRWGKVGLEKADIPSITTIKNINEHFNKTCRVDQLLSQVGNRMRGSGMRGCGRWTFRRLTDILQIYPNCNCKF